MRRCLIKDKANWNCDGWRRAVIFHHFIPELRWTNDGGFIVTTRYNQLSLTVSQSDVKLANGMKKKKTNSVLLICHIILQTFKAPTKWLTYSNVDFAWQTFIFTGWRGNFIASLIHSQDARGCSSHLPSNAPHLVDASCTAVWSWPDATQYGRPQDPCALAGIFLPVAHTLT